MATVGSVTSGITAKTGIGGLASGMDIDSLILKMTAASRLKVTKQEQSLQKLEWKQTAYRSVITALSEFRTKYFDSLSKTNFKGNAIFNTIRATVDADMKNFTATAQSNAVAGKAYVNSIQQLATAEYITNRNAVSTPLSNNNQDSYTDLADFVSQTNGQDKDFLITLDGVSRTIVIDSNFETDLKRIALADTNASYHITNPTAAEIDAFDLSTVTDSDTQTGYLRQALQNRVNTLFGMSEGSTAPRISVTSPTNTYIEFSTQNGSKLTVGYATQPAAVAARGENETVAEYNLRVQTQTANNHKATGLGALGFKDGQSNRINIYSSIAELRNTYQLPAIPPNATLNPDGTASNNYVFIINDTRITVNEDESLSSVMNKINSSQAGVTLSYSEVTDKFTLTSKTQGAGEHFIMGDTNGNLLGALGLVNRNYSTTITRPDGSTGTYTANNTNAADAVYGQNAIAYIDGQKIERSSNEFTVNGVAYSLKAIYNYDSTKPDGIGSKSPAEVSLSPDVTDLKESIKNFVTDYNALVDLVRGMTNEEAFSDYEPLTEEQRAAMTESQVKLWEEKAKSGILRGDSTVNKILSSMRQAFLSTSEGFGIFSMGISYGNATDSWKSYGKLTITDEAKLQSALEANPDQVRDFFTNASKGVATKLDKIIDDAVRTTGGQGHRGSLVEIAGLPSTLSEKENTLYTQMSDHNKRITALKESLKKEEERLWKQFSAMETALSKLNEQQNYLAQYLGQKKA
ncbi:MAG: flagellar filament capping protein FliD [Clostridiales Family XIII bacterium]|jgi:flagellar hook-associated protein 2|nr:flagellar filament capping protein FliD [Clostridiales Family XIII bacterium]